MYILRCCDGSFYVGHTDDLEKRIAEHNAGTMPCYTQKRLPVEVVYSQDFATRFEAIAAERRAKGWNRKKKQALVDGDWDLISELSKRNNI